MASSLSSILSLRPFPLRRTPPPPAPAGYLHLNPPPTSIRLRPLLSPSITSRRTVIAASHLHLGAATLISPNDQWGTWTALLLAGAFGLWSERTKAGRMLSGALVSILLGLAASSFGVITSDSPASRVVLEYLLPMSVPLLLFRADLRRIVRSTGTLLLAFLLGSVATTIGTIVAYLLVPMRSLGQDSWKIAAALMSRHIGGAVNYVAVSEALGVSPSVLAAGLAADNVMCAVYFTSLFALASKIPSENSPSTKDSMSAVKLLLNIFDGERIEFERQAIK